MKHVVDDPVIPDADTVEMFGAGQLHRITRDRVLERDPQFVKGLI